MQLLVQMVVMWEDKIMICISLSGHGVQLSPMSRIDKSLQRPYAESPPPESSAPNAADPHMSPTTLIGQINQPHDITETINPPLEEENSNITLNGKGSQDESLEDQFYTPPPTANANISKIMDGSRMK